MTRLPPLLRGPRLRLSAMLIANGLAQGATAIGTALTIRLAFARFSQPSGAQTIATPGGAFLIGAVFTLALTIAWLRMRERIDAERLGQDYIHEVRLSLFDQLTAVAPRTLQRRSRGGLMLRFVGDLTALRNWVSMGVARLAVALLFAGSALIVLSFIDARIAAAVALTLGLGLAASLALGRRMYRNVREARRRQSHLAANVNEKIGAMAVVQVFGQLRRERQRVARQSDRLKQALIGRAHTAGLLRGTAEATGALATGSVLLVGALETAAGRTSPSTIFAAVVIVSLLVPRLRDLSRVYEYWTGALVSRQKIEAFLADPRLVEETPAALSLEINEGRIEFDDVSLADTLKGVSAIAEPGSLVTLVGPNGSGKTTLLSLIARLIDPDRGRVLIDGGNVAEFSLKSVRRAIGIVNPDLPLLRGSIRKNLLYCRRHVTEEEFNRIISLCGVDRVLAELPEGAETRVREGGSNLSLGQRQCIALARALLADPKILLLDEIDAHLDPIARAAFWRVIAAFPGTVLMVTHRLDHIERADQVWHLREGRLVEAGPPGLVLAHGGPTAALFGSRVATAS